jgi:transposase-like protein
MSRQRKMAAVLRLLRGEDLETVSRSLGVTAATLSGWRNKAAAGRSLRKLLKKQMRPPRVLITDKLASYGAAKQDLLPGVEHRQHKGLDNRTPAMDKLRSFGMSSRWTACWA